MEHLVQLTTSRGVLRGVRHEGTTPAVLLGGWFSSTHIGAARLYVQIGRLLQRHGIGLWRVDPWGVGASDGDFADTTYDSELEDYARVIAESGARFLIGHSIGCGMALRLARPGDTVWLVAPSFGRTPPSLIDEPLREEILRTGGAERKATLLRADFLRKIEEPVANVPNVPCVAFRGVDEEHYATETIRRAVPGVRIVDVDRGDHNFLARGGREALWRAMEHELSAR